MRIKKQHLTPFSKAEKRNLMLRAGRIDPAKLIDGKTPAVLATFKRAERFRTHNARFFELTTDSGLLATVRVQLNNGNPRLDEKRLAEIAEELLSPAGDPENPKSEIRNPKSGDSQ